MTDSDIAWKVSEDVFIEDLRDQPHVGIKINAISLSGSYTSTFLASMLKSIQGKIGKPCYILTRTMNPKYATRLVQRHTIITGNDP